MAVTNVPELAVWVESYNLLNGRTVNPYDVSRTPGGSSGGEVCVSVCVCVCWGSCFTVLSSVAESYHKRQILSLDCGDRQHY
ncbi:Fatty-acid amide hydrolase 2 [Portunus trituberculatus]|uniref:Fatty-acid amide hydrolase 2 n=1 Tax=Portunus trituberculatus TaxID=210409 RepID=A0A5B7I224_PORTR|nr:Fatty-acid amide hydrolase 2 [Portunus trituberculatus]